MQRLFPILLFLVPGGTLAAGLALLAAGRADEAHLAFTGGTAVVLAVLLGVIVSSLARGAFGLDIIAAASMAGALWVSETLAGNVVALMFAGGQLLESYAQARAQREMTALLARQPRTALRYEEAGLVERPMPEIGPGDRLLVRSGDVVPVDGAVDADAAVVDEAALTGESVPIRRARGQPLMSGSTNVGPAFDMVAQRRAEESAYARIVRLVEAAQQARPPMARLADRWALGFLAFTAVLAGGTWFLTHDPIRTLAVLVVATPCPLILAVPVALVAGLSRCASHSVLVKSGAALEALARSRVLLLDKTGTLTSGVPRVSAVRAAEGFGEGDVLQAAAALAQSSPHVMSAALVQDALAKGFPLAPPTGVREDHGAGLTGLVEGRSVVLGSLDHVAGLVSGGRAAREALDGEEPPEGRAIVAVGIDGRFAGLVEMVDEPRAEARAVLEDLRHAGLGRIVLVTGDREAIARSIAEGLPIDRIVAQATPAGKVDIVKEEALHGPTLMVGDGVNDAPALAAAGVGIAMGARGAAATSEAADAVILQDNLDRLPIALRIARRARTIALESVGVGIGLSSAGMAAAALGFLSPLQGAVAQEVIDVAVILNALRALGGRVTQN
ncbi:MAG: heavy metal translocating P-type ATPase [Alsobacter sp.]